jgi:hypothetical protein
MQFKMLTSGRLCRLEAPTFTTNDFFFTQKTYRKLYTEAVDMSQPSQEYPPWLTPVPSVVTDAAGMPVTITVASYIPPTYYGPSVGVNNRNILSFAKIVNRFRWEHSTAMGDTHILRRSCGLLKVLRPLLQKNQLQWSQRKLLVRLQ